MACERPATWLLWRRPGSRRWPLTTWRSTSAAQRARRERGERWLRLYTLGAALPLLRPARAGGAALRPSGASRRWASRSVRRPTGGRAVWHAESSPTRWPHRRKRWAAPEAYAGDPPHAARSASADSARGRPRSPEPRRRRADAGACFAARRAGSSWLAAGRWWAARSSAKRGALLQHGTILLADDQRVVGAVTRGGAHGGPIHAGRPSARL